MYDIKFAALYVAEPEEYVSRSQAGMYNMWMGAVKKAAPNYSS